jgi:WD40 repeat protein
VAYTLRFVAKGAIVDATLAGWFRARRGYKLDGSRAAYENTDTGVSFSFLFGPAAKNARVALQVETPRSPVFGLEAELEARALVEKFGLQVRDPDAGDAPAPFEAESVVRGYAQENARAHKDALDAEHHELPSGVLGAAWRWNSKRAALENLHGEQTFVPTVVCVLHPETGQVCTATVWPDSMPTLLPHVDVLILAGHDDKRLWVETREVAHLLDAVGRRSARFRYRVDGRLDEAGLDHYDLSKDTEIGSQVLACARDGGGPETVPMESVLSRELMRMAMGIADVKREPKKKPEEASPFPRECRGFLRTRMYDLSRVLGGYTWRSPWRIEAIAHSKEGAVVAGVGAGGVVFFDAVSGNCVREVRGDAYAGTSVGISADGRTLALGDELGNVNIFDVDLTGTGPTLVKRFVHGVDPEKAGDSPPHGYVLGVSADGSTVVGGAGDQVFVLRDDEEPSVFEASGAVCASRDLKRVWTGDAVRDLSTGKESSRLLGNAIDPRTIRVPALSPDGQYLAFATSTGDLQVVRLEDGAVVASVTRKDARGAPAVARFIAYMPSGEKLVIGDSACLEVRAALTLEREKVFETPVWDAELSDTVIYRAADDRIWTQPLDGPAPPVNDGPITQLFHSARGPIAVATSTPGDGMTGGRAILWHLPSGAVLRATERLCPDRVNLSPDGRLLHLATETALRVLDVGSLEEIAIIEPLGDEKYVRPLDLDACPDGEHVLACLEGGLARMISLKTRTDRWREELGVRCATFSPDGKSIVVGDRGRLRVVDATTGAVDKEISVDDPRDEGEHVLITDGKRAARVVQGEGIAIVDLSTGTSEIQPLPRAKDVLAPSPDGRVIALVAESDDAFDDLVLWSVDASQEVDRVRLETAEDAPVSAAFSPDGQKLLVGTTRGALLVFVKR